MAITGDYIGFSFNGISSAELGIFRTQNGLSKDDLLPNFTDKTSTVDGVDETYYFYTQIQKREFTIEFAFESFTESQIRKLRTTFRPNLIGELVFDETPYKYYQAKISAPPSIEYVPFGEGNNDEGGRYYNGNGSIKFVCYYPYAKSKFKTLPNSSICPNVNEWAKSSGILADLTGYDTYESTTGQIKLYNPGDLESDLELQFYTTSSSPIDIKLKNIDANAITYAQMEIDVSDISTITQYTNYFRINSRNNLLTTCGTSLNNDWQVCNYRINSGDFFKIPITTTSNSYQITIENATASTNCIDYSYLYY